MVCRSMFIGEPRIRLEAEGHRIVIEVDYGTVVQEDGHAPSDEKLDFSRCIINNFNWDEVTKFLQENAIYGFSSFNVCGAQTWKSDKPDPYTMYPSCLTTLELRVQFSQEKDIFKAATYALRRSIDAVVVKNAIYNPGNYTHN